VNATNPPNLVPPPTRTYKRAGRWETFEKLFDPITHNGGTLVWNVGEVPTPADCRYWWTILDPMTTGQLYLAAGFHFVNRLGYVRCKNPWGGDFADHPEYLY